MLSTDSIRCNERRHDKDGVFVMTELRRRLALGEVTGTIFAVITDNGKIEMGCSGVLYDNPLLSSGLTSKLHAMADGHGWHPAAFIPEED